MEFNFAYIPLLLGITWLGYGIYRLKRYIILRANGKRVEGTVYELYNKTTEFEEGGKEIRYYMSVGFLTSKQLLIIKEIDVTNPPYQYKKGDTVNVIYDDASFEDILIEEDKSPAYTYFLWIFPGCIFIIVGVWMLLME